MKIKIILISLFYILVSCTQDTPKDSVQQWTNSDTIENNEKATPFKPFDISPQERMDQWQIMSFCKEILKESIKDSQPNENVMISPKGIVTILAMIANGADSKTANEITKAIGLDLEALNNIENKTINYLGKADNQVILNQANSIWLDNNLKLSNEYQDFIINTFNADIFQRELCTSSTRKEINLWCAEKTGGMINNFLTDNISPQIVVSLINALYFNGKWTHPFDKSNTYLDKFYCADGSISNVKMMHHEKLEARYGVSKDGGVSIAIPYGNTSFSMIIYLPPKDQSIEGAIKNADFLQISRDELRYCILSIPQFKIENCIANAKDILKSVGIERLFTNNADFSKIAIGCNFTDLMQKNSLEINESGSKAASATGAFFVGTSATNGLLKEPVKIDINRPFIFTIAGDSDEIHLISGAIRTL